MGAATAGSWLHVVAGALLDPNGRVLITRRHDDAHQGGLWEFPGGKLEPGEAPRAGLARELAEELGVEIRDCVPLVAVDHDYADRRVLLDVWTVRAWTGEPQGLEGQPLRWIAPREMRADMFPAADVPVIEALVRLIPTDATGR